MNPYNYPYPYPRTQNRRNIATSDNNQITTQRRDPFEAPPEEPFESPFEQLFEGPYEHPGRAFSSARIPCRMSTTPRDFDGSPRTPSYSTSEPQFAPLQEDIRSKAGGAAEARAKAANKPKGELGSRLQQQKRQTHVDILNAATQDKLRPRYRDSVRLDAEARARQRQRQMQRQRHDRSNLVDPNSLFRGEQLPLPDDPPSFHSRDQFQRQ